MTVTLFGTDFAEEIAGAFAGELEPGTLHAATVTPDLWGQQSRTHADVAIEGTILSWTSKQKIDRGWPATATVIMMLAYDKPEPVTDDEITMRGQRFRVLEIEDGGAQAVWNVAAVIV